MRNGTGPAIARVRRVAVLSLMIAVGVASWGCGRAELRGSSTGNIANYGLMAGRGQWVYYRSESDNWRFYKSKADGTTKTKLSDDIPAFINVIGDRLYYANYADGKSLYTLKTDGTDRKKLYDGWTDSINVVGDWVYFKTLTDAEGNSNFGACKMRADGTELTRLRDSNVSGLAVVDGRAYFAAPDAEIKTIPVYAMDLDGKSVTRLNNAYSHFINVQNGWIYYWNVDAVRAFRMKVDGSENQMISDDPCDYVNVSGGWVYYVNTDDARNIYRVKADGSSRQRLTDFAEPTAVDGGAWISSVYVIGDSVYFRGRLSDTDRGGLFRVACEGGAVTVFDGSK